MNKIDLDILIFYLLLTILFV